MHVDTPTEHRGITTINIAIQRSLLAVTSRVRAVRIDPIQAHPLQCLSDKILIPAFAKERPEDFGM